MNRIGYCCLSLGINIGKTKKNQILVNRGLVKRTFESKGLEYVSELIISNLKDTLLVLDYNIKNNIGVYRMSSDSFPFLGFYELDSLPKFSIIEILLKQIGDKIKNNDIRVSYHPGPYCVLASENPDVVSKTVNELNKHAELMDRMGLDQSTYYPINIHINTTKPSREEAANRFCNNFHLLSESCKKRLTIENDDKESQYSVKMLHELVYNKIQIPICFDQFHFKYGTQDQTMEEALKLAISTWKTKALTHISSSKRKEDESSKITAHSDYIYEKIESFGLEFDTELECKKKDIALLKYRHDFN